MSKNAERRRLAEQQSAQLAADAARRGMQGATEPAAPVLTRANAAAVTGGEQTAGVPVSPGDAVDAASPAATPPAVPARAPAAPSAEFMLVVNGKLDRTHQTAKQVQFTPTNRNWARFKAAFNGSSEQVGINAVFKAGLDALAARGGLIKIEAEDLT